MKYIIGTIATFLPVVATAQEFGEIGTFFSDIVSFINSTLVPLVFAVGLLFFLYGMFKYFIQEGASDDAREKGKQLAIWSIAGFVLMVSIWGIVNLIATGLFGTSQPPELPGTPTIGHQVIEVTKEV